MLSPKQEAFAQSLASGATQSDAYRAAYNVRPNTTADSIHQAASKLAADPKVLSRVAELKAPLVEKQLWTREMSVKGLVNAYKVSQQGQNASGMVAAVKELNAMHGFNAAAKHELTGANGGAIKTEAVTKIDYSKLTKAEIQAMAAIEAKLSA
jgi:hypothetical protein